MYSSIFLTSTSFPSFSPIAPFPYILFALAVPFVSSIQELDSASLSRIFHRFNVPLQYVSEISQPEKVTAAITRCYPFLLNIFDCTLCESEIVFHEEIFYDTVATLLHDCQQKKTLFSFTVLAWFFFSLLPLSSYISPRM
jgi:hypothetical protein